MNKIPIFIINLKRDIAKRNRMQAMLDKLNLEFNFFEAIDGNTLTDSNIATIYDKNNSRLKRQLSLGELGCAFSHINIYQKIITDNISQAIILEDDVIINKDFIDCLPIIDYAPQDWELILFGHSDAKTRQRHYCKINIPLKNNPTQFSLGKPLITVGGAYSYLIKQNGAKKLLASISDKLCQPIDGYTGNYTVINLYGIYPNPIRVDFGLGSSTVIQQPKRNKLHQKISDFNRRRKLNRTWTINCVAKIIGYKMFRLFR